PLHPHVGKAGSGRAAVRSSPHRPMTKVHSLANSRRMLIVMANSKEKLFEVACPDCGAMIKIDASTGLLISHTSAPRKRMFEDLETAAKAMREQDERKE